MSVGDTNDKMKGERKMFICVDWENREVKTEKEVKEEIEKNFNDPSLSEEYMSFDHYLNNYYLPCEIFNFSEKDKETVLVEYQDELYSLIEKSVLNKYKKVKVTI